MFTNLGETIRGIRQSMGISQKELAEGICSQSQISKIESGEISPYIHTLVQLAMKLGMEPGYFIEIVCQPEYTFIQNSIKSIRTEVRNKNYKEVRRIVNQLKNHPSFKNHKEKQFLKWHEGIVSYYLDHDYQQSLNYLNDALHLSSSIHPTFQNIEILNSKAIIYCEEGLYDKGISIFKQILTLETKVVMEIDTRILTRIYYNLSKTLYKIRQYKESLFNAEKGIAYLLELESFYLLGEFYYQAGASNISLGKKSDGFKYFHRAENVFLAKNDQKSLQKLLLYLKSLPEKKK